jgi:hypothetical protein
VLVAEHHAGQRLDLHSFMLSFWICAKFPDLGLRELDVLQVLAGELVDAALYLLRRGGGSPRGPSDRT